MLFFQNAPEPLGVNLTIVLAIVVPLLLLGIAAAGCVLVLRYLRFSRDKQHVERLKMIESGYPVEDSESSKRQDKFMHNAFWISFWMVVAVPGGVFSAAATATDRLGGGTGVLFAVWIGAAVASVAAVVCAAVLMVYSRAGKDDLQSETKLPSKRNVHGTKIQ